MKRTIIAISAALSIGLAIPAQAELLEADWQNEGDGNAVLDTSTNLEWLDLGLTDNMSYNTTVSLLDGALADWRLPTFNEVQTLFYSFFPSYTDSDLNGYEDTSGGTLLSNATLFYSLFNTSGADAWTYGLVDDGGVMKMSGIYYSGSAARIFNTTAPAGAADASNAQYSTYLVRNSVNAPDPEEPVTPEEPQEPETPVTEPADVPAPLSIAGLALGIAAWRYRRQA
ncbi:MAG: hypothetical protein CL531_00600 [Aestuariibacter sp.]|nr:hypothetical protein [Aestuariibacter sp.]|tara:strand:- start:924 stop:1604 length:681 start_codon:yes stop_codon:yes gene_type:complete